ncbi:hypothetical protein GCM10023116_26900 [Kistimonas scapharcae]|uniref:Zinc ribbon domain-containing protein n=1 Tax=Kistimonas scapharcae TaxID=1036133 RepID=A0ABP8V3K5_9GAMM
MGKPYNRKKVQQQAFIGWLIIAAGFAVQLLLETFLWNESRPDMAGYLIGIPFAIGGILFLHALLTFMTGKEHHPLHHRDEDVSDPYQANMVRIRRHFKVCALVFLVGGGLFATFIITKIAFFSVGFFILFVGVFCLMYGYHQWARCPACRYLPTESTGGNHQRILLDLTYCPHCGARMGKD